MLLVLDSSISLVSLRLFQQSELQKVSHSSHASIEQTKQEHNTAFYGKLIVCVRVCIWERIYCYIYVTGETLARETR